MVFWRCELLLLWYLSADLRGLPAVYPSAAVIQDTLGEDSEGCSFTCLLLEVSPSQEEAGHAVAEGC